MDIARLRHIVAVADTRSFSRAAEQQNITQPALSRSIAAFETRHGLKLFDRGRGGVTVTPAGDFVVEQARGLIRAADEMARNVRLYAQGAAGRVAFGLGPLLASLVLPGLGSRLLASHPSLEIATLIKPAVDLLPDLFDDTIEMIIGTDWQIADVPGIAVEEIALLELAHVVRRDHPLAAMDRVKAEDLAAYPAARPVRTTAGKADAGAFICDNFHILRETALATDCTWITAPAFVRAELADGRMTVLAVEGLPLAKSRICLITLAARTRSPASRIVADLVRQAVRACA